MYVFIAEMETNAVAKIFFPSVAGKKKKKSESSYELRQSFVKEKSIQKPEHSRILILS